MIISVFDRVENFVGKEEIACTGFPQLSACKIPDFFQDFFQNSRFFAKEKLEMQNLLKATFLHTFLVLTKN